MITQTNNEDNTLMHGIALIQCVPVISIDLWEHAYLMSYSDREAYIERVLAHLDWGKISANFESHVLQGKVAPILPE